MHANSISSTVIFEIFSGSCILSRTFAQRGFQAIAFDHIQAPQYKVFHLDLCNVKDQTLLCTLIRKLRPSMIWLAPPCGTAKPKTFQPLIIKATQFLFLSAPVIFPMDFQIYHLINTAVYWQQTRCTHWVAKIICLCEDLRIPWVLENPGNSYMWLTSPLRSLPAFPSVSLHNCMYGGARPKLTQLLFHGLDLSPLHLLCDNSHQHLPWKVNGPYGPEFQTAVERAYPVGLCKAVVQLFLHHCLRQGFQDIPTSLTDTSDIATPFYRRHLRGGVGLQPRGRQLAVLPNGFVDLWVPSSQLDIHTFLPGDALEIPLFTTWFKISYCH